MIKGVEWVGYVDFALNWAKIGTGFTGDKN